MMAGTRERPIVLRHARRRIKQMGLTDHRVAEVLVEPEHEYPGAIEHPDQDVRRFAVRGDLVVVFTTEPEIRVVTVMWHRAEGRDE